MCLGGCESVGDVLFVCVYMCARVAPLPHQYLSPTPTTRHDRHPTCYRGLGHSRQLMADAMEVSNRTLRSSELFWRLSNYAEGGAALLVMTLGADTPAITCT